MNLNTNLSYKLFANPISAISQNLKFVLYRKAAFQINHHIRRLKIRKSMIMLLKAFDGDPTFPRLRVRETQGVRGIVLISQSVRY